LISEITEIGGALMKSVWAVIISIILFAFVITSCSSPSSPTTLKIGDYVQMGKYYDEPIMWRCVDIDENGPLLLADKILTIKAFDAKGNHKYLDGTPQEEIIIVNERTASGSGLWETSNIRSWLNSTATAGNVTWLDGGPPTSAQVFGGFNAYSDEKGFLANGNFAQNEINVIKSVTQKSLIDSHDVPKLGKGGTTDLGIPEPNIVTILEKQNYDTTFYQNVTDKMFLLDIKQINKVYQNSSILGKDYYKAKQTQKVVDNVKYPKIEVGQYWNYWLRTPATSYLVRLIDSKGDVNIAGAYTSSIGVRPAFYIVLSSISLNTGKGTLSNPYIIK
jgi:hypothetical protein